MSLDSQYGTITRDEQISIFHSFVGVTGINVPKVQDLTKSIFLSVIPSTVCQCQPIELPDAVLTSYTTVPGRAQPVYSRSHYDKYTRELVDLSHDSSAVHGHWLSQKRDEVSHCETVRLPLADALKAYCSLKLAKPLQEYWKRLAAERIQTLDDTRCNRKA